MEKLKEFFNIDSESNTYHYKKGTVLQVQGDMKSNGYFVKKGLLKSYSLDEKGKEHIFMFAPEGWIISDVESIEFDHPSVLSIECIEDSEVIVLNRKKIFSEGLNLQQYKKMVGLFSRRIAVLQRRMIMMMSASATERYQSFIEDYPELPNRVPQRMIASYLGITPEALSKIRGQLARTK